MFMPMTPLQSWALILLIGFALFLLIQAVLALPVDLDTDVDAEHDEGEPDEGPAAGRQARETRLYDWAVDGI